MSDQVDTLDAYKLDDILETFAIARYDRRAPRGSESAYEELKAKLSALLVEARKAQITEIRDEWAKWLAFPDDDPHEKVEIADIVAHCDLLIEELEKHRESDNG